MGVAEHLRESEKIVPRVAVLTLSDTRGEADDASGRAILRHLDAGGMTRAGYAVIRDEPTELLARLRGWADESIDAIITNGGTGISRRDQTIGVVRNWITTELPGFGEIFRMLSYEQVGPAAMMSRAVAGLRGRQAIFALPGSTAAVELAMERLIVPQLRHVIREARK